MNFIKKETTGLGWTLFAIGLSVPWLIPVHTDPWPTLYSEVAAGLVLLPLAVWLFGVRCGRLEIDALTIGFALAALVTLVQAACGMFLFPAEAPVVSLYLAGFAMVVALARRAEEAVPGRLPDVLFAGLVIAALVSTALALAQWLHLDWGPLLAAIPDAGARTVANVGQTNELSTLLMWGLVGVWWAYSQRRIGGTVSLLAAAFVLLGVASTQSRTGWLAVGLLLVTAMASPARLESAKHRPAFILLGLWFITLVAIWPVATRLIGGEALSLDAQLMVGLRPKIWAMMLDGIGHQPWLGYGWNQGRLVQLGELPNYAELKIGVQHAHNLVLDLVVWNGVPLGLSFAALLGTWFWRQWRCTTTAAQALLLLALFMFMLHAMLELPHCKAFFLMPVALMMGILNAHSGLLVVFRIPRAVAGLGVAALAGVLVLTVVDYRRIEVDLQAYRMRMAWNGIQPVPPAPVIYVLGGLQTALVNLRIEPLAGMEVEVLEHLRITATRYPIEPVLFKYAKAAALNGQPEAAQESLKRWCLLFNEERCDLARSAWDEFKKGHPEVEFLPFPSL